MSEILTSMVGRLFADHCSDAVVLRAEEGTWPEALWDACEAAGLALALIEAGEHSLGASAEEAFQVVRLAGRVAAPIPLPETMLANWLLGVCGLEPRPGPLVVVASPTLHLDASGTRLIGEAAAVPWGRRANVIACFERAGRTCMGWIGRDGFVVEQGANIAREPRDHLVFDVALSDITVTPLPPGIDAMQLRAAGAALRCGQMAGALERVTTMTVEYTGQRVQFGRSISKFQAVQQNVAVLASQTAAASCAADMAAEAFGNGIQLSAVAAAKTFCGEAAGLGAAIAHQVHGAMGFSQEYSLHLRTKRLWSWREEYGNEVEWSAWLGLGLLDQGADQLWAGIAAI